MNVTVFPTPSLGDSSYLVANSGIGIVIDPQRDIERFIESAAQAGVEVGWVLETHLHNDYLSGGLHLAQRTGAELVLPAGSGANFPFQPAFHLEEFGEADLTVRPIHTPGHTPEHVSYLLLAEGRPVALFSGGSLLVGSAGRSDLLGLDRARQLGRLQFGSLRRLASLPDDVAICPTHGAGSFCSIGPAGPATSTIGAERLTNPTLKPDNAESFVEAQLANLRPFPTYYGRMGGINASGPAPFDYRPPPELSATALAALPDDVEIVDARRLGAFLQGHIPRAFGIAWRTDFPTWVGWLLPFAAPLALVLDEDEPVEEVVVSLARIGFDDVQGFIRGMTEWIEEGRPVTTEATFDGETLPDSIQVLDVRAPGEWSAGHLEGAIHCYVPDLVKAIPATLDRTRPVYVGCSTGYRATIAAGWLSQAGYRPVVMTGKTMLRLIGQQRR